MAQKNSRALLLQKISNESKKASVPTFRTGDTVKVHAKIIEGTKERVQIFEGVVIKRSGKNGANATFTVRKISYNIGVERTFYLHSPRIEKIEILGQGRVRRSRLFYLRDLRGKASKIETTSVPEAGSESTAAA
jgi:large subunit ribosomal protein L19